MGRALEAAPRSLISRVLHSVSAEWRLTSVCRRTGSSGKRGERVAQRDGRARYTTVKELIDLIAREAGVPSPWLRLPSAPMFAAAAACEAVCRWLGIEPPLYRRRLDFFLKHRAFKIDRARETLGWEPRIGLEAGIRQTMDYYRGQRWL